MPSLDEEIEELEREIKKTQYNKATEHHIGRLKAKIAKLERIREERRSKGGGTGFFIKKSIYPTVGLIGPPSVGKSSILNAITNAESKVGDFDFTTLSIVPGVMEFNGLRYRILDLPGVIEGAHQGRGRGREVISVLRNVDLIVIILDPYKSDPDYILSELRKSGIRLNENPPKISIVRKNRGGLSIMAVGKAKMDRELIESVCREFGIINADVIIRESVTLESFIDGILGNRSYIPGFFVMNKADVPEFEESYRKLMSKGFEAIPVSVTTSLNIDLLKERISKAVRMIRIYLKPVSGQGDDEPLVVREGSSIEDVCLSLHSDFVEKFKFATVVGPSVRYPNQRVGLEHIVEEGDRISIYIKKG
ncbi:MAG: OBG GTPase family GTP-binding protein [Thermoplasmata archaeon]